MDRKRARLHREQARHELREQRKLALRDACRRRGLRPNAKDHLLDWVECGSVSWRQVAYGLQELG